MLQPAGAQWCARFPTSDQISELQAPFRDNAARFIRALRDAGASVKISATYRPAERAYLMHWCCMVAQSGQDPAGIPAMHGVDIDWTCGGDRAKAKAEAGKMMAGYNIAFPAALISRHTQRRAIDMTAHWPGIITVHDAHQAPHACEKQADLWPIGAGFGVIKLPSDPPHWSDDGH